MTWAGFWGLVPPLVSYIFLKFWGVGPPLRSCIMKNVRCNPPTYEAFVVGDNFTLDLIGDDVARGNTGAGTTRVKSCLTVLRDHAKSYMKQARKSGRTLIQRFNEDPMFQYNCAVQDITPQCLDFIRDLGRTEVPKLDRTAEEIRSGKIRQFKAKLCLVNDEDSDELDVNKHILIWFRNRFYRIGQFAAAYAQFDLQDRFTVLSFLEKIWSSDGLNGDEVLEDLLVFIEENVSKPLQMRQGTGRRSLLPAPNQPQGSTMHRTVVPGWENWGRGDYSAEEWNAYYSRWTDEEWERWRLEHSGHSYRSDRGPTPGYWRPWN